MCGIYGYIGKKDAYPVIKLGLEKLEYRGYDSCGVCLSVAKGFFTHKTIGGATNLPPDLDFDANNLHDALNDLDLNIKVWNFLKWKVEI